ncbi:MAG: IclR family transcriptional regulator C-terminal domain-containing protein [Gammaproteobacteria bacterium]
MPSRTRPASARTQPINGGEHLETLAKGIAALRLFGAELKSLSIQETADQLQLSRSAARRILVTLEHLGFLIQEEGRRYRLTAKVLDFGFSYIASRSLPEIARPVMRALSQKLDESVALATLEDGDAVFIERIQPHQTFRIDFDVGNRLPAYSFSVGQVLLAGLDDDALDQYFRTTRFKALTPLTETDPKALRRIVGSIRRDGYRLGINDMIYGVGGIAVPIRNRQGQTVASMVVPMFHGRDQAEMMQRYLPAMQAAAEEISSFVVRGRTG